MSLSRAVCRSQKTFFSASRCLSTATRFRNRSQPTIGGAENVPSDLHGDKELGVGEIEGASFRVEPIRRTGEDVSTTRARLLYQSRKRGTLESDLLLSTFADANLGSLSAAQLEQYDRFLDENDWDIYYWATQEPSPTQGAEVDRNSKSKDPSGKSPIDSAEWKRPQVQGEWAQTVGAFKPAYRPVPMRWRNSEILSLIRKHVKDRSAGGVHESSGEEEGVKLSGKGGGLGMMPKIRQFDA